MNDTLGRSFVDIGNDFFQGFLRSALVAGRGGFPYLLDQGAHCGPDMGITSITDNTLFVSL